MDVILSHSNTDFDGLAAQFAAARLFSPAIPVLHAQLNANVRSFLALAREELPFVTLAQLPNRPITRLILVDTDTIPRLPQLADPPATTIIIDHHPPARDLAANEQRIDGDAGATTTLLVLQMAEAGMPTKPLEATLLLLGIYEDTGRLTLGSTRPDDLRAAAWLLEHGARLEAVGEFLARPLTDAQEQVLAQLEETRQIEQIKGWPVLTASASIAGSVPELSPLAHRLRDQYGPAVTALAIGTSDAGTQLILRANPEALDAGALAHQFGGGGHAAAAAAFIRNQPVASVLPLLQAELMQRVQPALTAASLMTRHVKTVSVDASVAHAATLQQRSGHSALPVVDRMGIVRGLIARADLDRALRHGLGDAPIIRYMWRGPQLIAPTTSLAEVRQALLDETGRVTGRLLVVDQQRHLLGIVTRADLLRAWELPSSHAEEPNERMIAVLETGIPAPILQLVHLAASLAEASGWALYLVGGSVRDLLLDTPPGDLDLVVEGDAVGLATALAQASDCEVQSHSQFGTATVTCPERGSLDFVTARTEFYERPAALPEVEASSLRHDLHRRDFTINTLAICLNPTRYGRLYDFYGGQRDLQRRLIRVLHNLSFIDDPTRMIRAARLAARLGCSVEPRTQALISDAVEQRVLSRTSGQRILEELCLSLHEPQPDQVLTLLQTWGVLAAIHPALHWGAAQHGWLATARQNHSDEVYLAIGIALLTHSMKPEERQQFGQTYRLNTHLLRVLDDVSTVLAAQATLAQPQLRDSQIDQYLHGLDDAALLAAQIMVAVPAAQRIARYCTLLREIQLEIDGHTLIALGLKPGPAFRTMLTDLRAARLDGLVLTREEQIAWVREHAPAP